MVTALERAAKNERDAVARAREIIARLQGDPLDVAAESKRTRHGELRLNHCRKYDLACGFRLIAVKRDSLLIFVCIGSHDDCQRWIKNNRDNLDDIETIPVPPGQIPSTAMDDPPVPSRPVEEKDEYEEMLMARLDEKLLREIFPVFS